MHAGALRCARTRGSWLLCPPGISRPTAPCSWAARRAVLRGRQVAGPPQARTHPTPPPQQRCHWLGCLPSCTHRNRKKTKMPTPTPATRPGALDCSRCRACPSPASHPSSPSAAEPTPKGLASGASSASSRAACILWATAALACSRVPLHILAPQAALGLLLQPLASSTVRVADAGFCGGLSGTRTPPPPAATVLAALPTVGGPATMSCMRSECAFTEQRMVR